MCSSDMRPSLGSLLLFVPLILLVLNVGRQQFVSQPIASATAHRRIRLPTRRYAAAVPPSLDPPPPPPLPPPPPSQSAATASAKPATTPQSGAMECNGTAHTELWGSVVLAGTDNPQPSSEACCRSCRAYEPTLDVNSGAQCNTFVWHLDPPHECWLKHQHADALAGAVKSLAAARDRPSANTKVRWASGVVLDPKPCADCVVPSSFYGCIAKDRCNTSRSCGSPAIDGYSHVDPVCFDGSPTAKLY